MDASPIAIEQLKEAAELAWGLRWQFAWDMNGDGIVSILDVGHWIAWIFFAPGDFILLETMLRPTRLALSLGILPKDLSGFGSGILSLLWWFGMLLLGRR